MSATVEPKAAEFLTVRELAHRWKRAERGIRDLIESGAVPAFRPADVGPWLIRLDDVMAIEARGQSSTPSQP